MPPPTKSDAFISPAAALTKLRPGWLDELTPLQRDLASWYWGLWLRPEQRIPRHHWRTFGLDGGRGFGKTLCFGAEINRRVAEGRELHVGLMGPTDDRVDEVQLETLINTAPPWNRPRRYNGGLLWPNGVKAVTFTPKAPGRPRSENISLAWCCEIVDWDPNTRDEAYGNLSTATRIGRAQIMWDSTNKGRNDLLAKLRADHERDPHSYVIVGGQTFDNPLLSTQYLRDQWHQYAGVRRREELFGEHFEESEGALFKQAWLDKHRLEFAPNLESVMVAVDPAQSVSDLADESGIMRGGRADDGHVYLTDDLSGRYRPEEWGDRVVDACHVPHGHQVVLERNHLGENAAYVVRSRAEAKGLRTQVLGRDERWPRYHPDVIYIREHFSRESKGARAEGPASETERGRVHLIGEYHDLERELTTYVPGRGRSPNRLDAFAFLVAELAGLGEKKPRPHPAALTQAASAHSKLQATVVAKRKRIGL